MKPKRKLIASWRGVRMRPVLASADPDAPVPSLTVTVTLELPYAVGVPEIRPLEALIASPAGMPVAE